MPQRRAIGAVERKNRPRMRKLVSPKINRKPPKKRSKSELRGWG
jgi:hypothetical protein